MENGDDTNIGEDEKIVLRTIKRIKSNRNKACYQNILAFVRRENKEITIENIKATINNLLKRNIIVDINKGKTDIESFKFVTDENLENSETETTNRNSLEDFINEKFYETLVNKIKDEVKNAIAETSLNRKDINVINPLCENEAYSKNNNYLVNVLVDRIKFLKSELKSKDSIIKMLISDRISAIPNNTENLNRVSCNNVNFSRNVDSNKLGEQKINSVNRQNINLNTDQNCERHDDGFQKAKATKKRSVTILGDSMIKELKPHLMRKKLRNKSDRLYVHSFSGATTKQMEHYCKPPMAFNPELIILHTGTNSLRGERTPEELAEEIIDLATSLKSDENEIVISEIIARRDQLNEKVLKVNDILRMKSSEMSIGFITHNNINTDVHLNPKGLHLNHQGNILLSVNVMHCVNA